MKKIYTRIDLWYETLSKWITTKSLKSNAEKFRFMELRNKTFCKHTLVMNSKSTEADDNVILLGTTAATKLTFKKHIDNLCCNARYLLCALGQIRKFFVVEEAKTCSNSSIESQYGSASLI